MASISLAWELRWGYGPSSADAFSVTEDTKLVRTRMLLAAVPKVAVGKTRNKNATATAIEPVVHAGSSSGELVQDGNVGVQSSDPSPMAPRSGLSFPVVGLGASAGGLAAVTRLLEAMPATPGMAFVVVKHLSPQHESSVAEILQRSTRMEVVRLSKPTAIQRDTVYVLPPTHSVLMYDGHL